MSGHPIVSNADVERIFSLVSTVKTKAGNRMQLKLFNAIVRIRSELLLSGKCSRDFTASPEMLKRFITDVVYSSQSSADPDLDLFCELIL